MVTALQYLLAEEGQLDLFLQVPESSAVELDTVQAMRLHLARLWYERVTVRVGENNGCGVKE
jgi:hypothetical protein